MQPTTGSNSEREEWISGWTTMMITIWKEKMDAQGIQGEGNLKHSFAEHIQRAGNDIEVIRHEFNLYGIYVDRGSGNGLEKRIANRKAKPWINKAFRRSSLKAMRYMADFYGVQGARMLVTTLK